jgi:Helix-turn-helix of DDE superfamily endonuclease
MPSYAEVSQRAGSVRAMTGLTQQEFMAFLPHVEHAFLAYMADHTIDGQPCTNRRYSTYDISPLPTMADKLLFILTYLKQNPIQEVQGQLFGMSQSHANTWIHLLHTVLHQALAQQELLPARTAGELATLLTSKQSKEGTTPPLFGMIVLSAPSIAPGMLKSNKSITAARKNARRSKTSS